MRAVSIQIYSEVGFYSEKWDREVILDLGDFMCYKLLPVQL